MDKTKTEQIVRLANYPARISSKKQPRKKQKEKRMLRSIFASGVGLGRRLSQVYNAPVYGSILRGNPFSQKPELQGITETSAITNEWLGREVKLTGWVQSHRPLGGLLFILLRDYSGTIQLVWSPEKTVDNSPDAAENLETATSNYSLESVIEVKGRVRHRPESMINPQMRNGELEVLVLEQKLINKADVLPYVVFGKTNITEETRLKYRYLDLRRPEIQKNILLRSKVALMIRNHLASDGFVEIETPTLTKSTPEGAREFVVPSRSPSLFYALPQSPQQYKQLLMASGFKKYFQIARCYRDEGNRADRQPEFTQVDIEMAFVEANDVIACMEGLVKNIWKNVIYPSLSKNEFEKVVTFPRMSYREAMTRYGSDKPDTRFGLEICDVTEEASKTDFGPFKDSIKAGGKVKALCVPFIGSFYSNANVKELTDEALKLKEGVKGPIFTSRVTNNLSWKSSMAKNVNEEMQIAISQKLGANENDILFFTTGSEIPSCITLGRIRLLTAAFLRSKNIIQIPEDTYNFLWVTDFPLFEVDDEREVGHDGKHPLRSMHHPFTNPHPEDLNKLEDNPLQVRGLHYDLVLNGVELGGGSIRVHNPVLQQHIFEKYLQLPSKGKEFEHLISALKSGCPPHGGIALGFDRLLLMLCNRGEQSGSIRDVIAFPKTSGGNDLLFGSPAPLTPNQLGDLGLSVTKPR